ncbi:hypothetical protein C1H46_043337 [Malus baccata]|uniref:Uncharacterized protein n=1 Tax=Malus baccata TaxID=106549 RepID=A0A540KB30_MALBA|nr:hypothetical protein C1H46_043337 [Malus baccata]
MARAAPAIARELLAASFSGMVFGFLEDGQEFPESYGSSSDGSQENDAFLLDEEEEAGDQEEKDKGFWEKQHQLLQVIDLTYIMLWYQTMNFNLESITT